MKAMVITVLLAGYALAVQAGDECSGQDAARRKEYLDAVMTGAGLLPWQARYPTQAEAGFRAEIELRKDALLATKNQVQHPVMFAETEFERARRNIASASWAAQWFREQQELAGYLVNQPAEYVDRMIEELTPGNIYGFTCPHCVDKKSMQGVGNQIVQWDFHQPEELCCKLCGQVYPSPDYPETAVLQCPRMGQAFTGFLNSAELAHPSDHSGNYAYHWVGFPLHVSFTGLVRYHKASFMLGGLSSLAWMYRLTGETSYAERAVAILVRLAHCYRLWLYHDYWDTIADCDPMYAAWHDKELPLDWKRHLCQDAYKKDTLEHAGMLQSYWGAGRFCPSTDGVSTLALVCEAYDLVSNATSAGGQALWTSDMRACVERDLILEWVMGAEPFVGGAGQAQADNNKAPRIYCAQAAVAMCLGIPRLADIALRGYEITRDQSFLLDGFSTETPGYTNMFLTTLIDIPERLQGFRWPAGIPGRDGVVDQFGTDGRLRMMLRGVVDRLRPDGRHLPLGDTQVDSAPSTNLFEVGLRRYPEYFRGNLPALYRGSQPSRYAVLQLEGPEVVRDEGLHLPEIYYPAWMTAILRHGAGQAGTVLTLTFSPHGNHRHPDNLALFYADRGQTILGDLGYQAGLPVNGWIESTKSHNLVIVDDQEQRFWGGTHHRQPFLQLMLSTDSVSVAAASSVVYDQCREYRRMAALVKGPSAETFVVDIFHVKGGRKHDYRIFSELASSDCTGGTLEFSGVTLPPEPAFPKTTASTKEEDTSGLQGIRSATAPPDGWQAVWKEPGRSYRLWMVTPAQVMTAANGPGQERSVEESGRRVRYVDVIRTGENLVSSYVAVHEPSGPGGVMPIKNARRLATPSEAGPDAVALRIDSTWGAYLVFSDFLAEASVAGVRFKGDFGILRQRAGQADWLLTSGAQTCMDGDFGFSDKTAHWKGAVEQNTQTEIMTEPPRPTDWPDLATSCQNYVLVDYQEFRTGFPVIDIGANRITVDQFPLPQVHTFDLPALRTLRREKG